MEDKIEIPCIFYLYLHSKIFEKTKGRETPTKELQTYLFQWKIPKQLRWLILKELEMLKLIEIKRYTTEINRPQFKIDDYYKYYEAVGVIENKK